jgi:hypothetical protein
VLPIAVKCIFLHPDAGGVEFAAAEGVEIADEGGELLEIGEGGGVGVAVPCGESNAVSSGEEAGGVVGHAARGLIEVLRGFGGVAGTVEEFVAELPLDEAAVSPLGQVLLADGTAIEVIIEDFPDFRKGIEPREKVGAGDAAFELAVEFVAKGPGEAGDFAVSFHGDGAGVCCYRYGGD